MARGFKLGPALVRAPDSTAQLPDTWRTDLLLKYLDRNDRLAVAQTCKAGLNLLLDEWEDATLIIAVRPSSDNRRDSDERLLLAHTHRADLSLLLGEWEKSALSIDAAILQLAVPGEPVPRLLRRMRAAREQLQRRREGSTRLCFRQVEAGVMSPEDTWWQVALSNLIGACDTITQCSLYLRHIPHQLLCLAGQALPALRVLELGSPGDWGSFSAQLPSPSHLPSLRELTIKRTVAPETQTTLWTSVAPYLPQLLNLSIADQTPSVRGPATQRPAWTSIFSRTSPSKTLTTLTLPVQLTPWLAALLQKAAPALAELTVWDVADDIDGAADVAPVCSWHTLRATQYNDFPASAWDWLPMPAEAKKLVLDYTRHACRADLAVNLPMSDKVASKFKALQTEGLEFLWVHGSAVHADDQPAMLRRDMRSLESLKDKGLGLIKFTMSPSLAHEVSRLAGWWQGKLDLQELVWPLDCPPLTTALPYLRVLSLVAPLTDRRLTQLVESKAKAEEVFVPGIELDLDADALPEGASALWDKINVFESVSLATWARQARLFGSGVVWQLSTVELELCDHQVLYGEHANTIQDLKQISLSECEELHIKDADHAAHHTCLSYDKQTTLKPILAVANALSCVPGKISITGYEATDDVILQLRDLPRVGELSLCLRSCHKPGDPVRSVWPLARAPWLIPRSVQHLTIAGEQLQTAEVEAFLFSLPADRTEEEPLWVKVTGKEATWVEDVNTRLMMVGSYPHVLVSAA